MSLNTKIKQSLRILYSLPSTLYFNFKNLPFHQAKKLPVILYRTRLLGKGKFVIEGPVKTGMIRFGFPMVSIYRETGGVLENNGELRFKGQAYFGGGAAISVGKFGQLTVGSRFCNQTGGKIVCYHKVDLGNVVRMGWHALLCDTDFHSMVSEDGLQRTKGYGEIRIGDNVWLGSYCKIFKNSVIPSKCTVAAGTIVNKAIECLPCSLIYSGDGIKVKYTGLFRDIDNDSINYQISE